MCQYCGCLDVEAFATLNDDHDRLREIGRDLTAAAVAEDTDAAAALARQMQAILGPHTYAEESALFTALRRDFPDEIDDLVAEHGSVDAALTEVASGAPHEGWTTRLAIALHVLTEHIFKEQDGLFPAALALVSPATWARVAELRTGAATPVQR